MNITYVEYKKLRKFFKANIMDYVREENLCPFKTFDNMLEEWFNVKDNYKNVEAYLKDLKENGIDSF